VPFSGRTGHAILKTFTSFQDLLSASVLGICVIGVPALYVAGLFRLTAILVRKKGRWVAFIPGIIHVIPGIMTWVIWDRTLDTYKSWNWRKPFDIAIFAIPILMVLVYFLLDWRWSRTAAKEGDRERETA
jgi:hypothetical protein